MRDSNPRCNKMPQFCGLIPFQTRATFPFLQPWKDSNLHNTGSKPVSSHNWDTGLLFFHWKKFQRSKSNYFNHDKNPKSTQLAEGEGFESTSAKHNISLVDCSLTRLGQPSLFCSPGRIRTYTVLVLNQLPLPIGTQGHNYSLSVLVDGIEPPSLGYQPSAVPLCYTRN